MDDKPPWKTPISFQNKDYMEMQAMMASKEEYALFPMSTINDKISLQSPE
jgi:hypothetical protein